MILSIRRYKNVIIRNKHHKKNYYCRKGVIIIDYLDRKSAILDLESKCDISNCEYLELFFIDETMEKIIFENKDVKRVERYICLGTMPVCN